jgi:uroporphyrinogen decarboxylase
VLALAPDGVQLGDDFGTQEALLLAPEQWRRFFRPRYEKLLAPARAAGVDLFFHSCGQIGDLLSDFADLGVNALWPQINLFDWPAFARRCRELKLALALHPERSHLMTHGTPAQVRQHVDDLAAAFRPQEGGSWFYLEIDNGFPWENVEALFAAVAQYR